LDLAARDSRRLGSIGRVSGYLAPADGVTQSTVDDDMQVVHALGRDALGDLLRVQALEVLWRKCREGELPEVGQDVEAGLALVHAVAPGTQVRLHDVLEPAVQELGDGLAWSDD
jgi:hypothetical protein